MGKYNILFIMYLNYQSYTQKIILQYLIYFLKNKIHQTAHQQYKYLSLRLLNRSLTIDQYQIAQLFIEHYC